MTKRKSLSFPPVATNSSAGLNTQLVPINEEEVSRVFMPLGAQDDEIPEITENLTMALDALDKYYVQRHPDVADELLEKISELSDTRKRFHAPYELIVDALRDNPSAIKMLCSMDDTDASPREILNEILSAGPIDYDDPDDDDNHLPFLAMAI